MPLPDHPVKSSTRYGPRRAGTTRRVAKGLLADPGAPTAAIEFLRVGEYLWCQWVIVMPAGVTSYDVTFYRYVDDGSGEIALVVADETVSATETLVYYQPVDAQPILARVHNIVGVVGDGFDLVATGVNRGAA